MQETELRYDLLSFLDDVETAIIKKQYDRAREDIQEYREYLKNTTKIEASTLDGTASNK